MAPGLQSAGFDSPTLQQRREKANARKVNVPGKTKRASQNKNPEHPLQKHITSNGSMAAAGLSNKLPNSAHSDEKMDAEHIFETASVNIDNFDVTLSSIPLENAQHHGEDDEDNLNEDGHQHAGGYQYAGNNHHEDGYENHNTGHQRNGHSLGRAGSRGQQNTSDEEYLSDDQDDRKVQIEEDRTLMPHDAAFNRLNDLQKNPKFNDFKALNFQEPGARNPFANHPPMNQPRHHHQYADINVERFPYKQPAVYLDDMARHASPTANMHEYLARKQNSLSIVDSQEDWQGSDGLGHEDHGQGQLLVAPNGEEPESRQMAESAHHPRGNQHHHENEEIHDVSGSHDEYVSADYSEQELYKMDYATLKDQPFDAEPAKPTPKNDEPTGPSPADTLEGRLAQMFKEGTEQQIQLFSTMSKDDWEKSGDWFMSQFTNVMNKLKDARETRRGITKKFEDEIAAREQAVRGKTQGIEKELSEMKSGGQGVLNRKPKTISTGKKSRGEAAVNRKPNGVDKGTNEKKMGGGMM